jgi:hypothetical protein
VLLPLLVERATVRAVYSQVLFKDQKLEAKKIFKMNIHEYQAKQLLAMSVPLPMRPGSSPKNFLRTAKTGSL